MSDIKSHHPVIELAWRRQTELSKNSTSKRDEYYTLRKWITYLGVAADLFAILYDTFHDAVPEWASFGAIYVPAKDALGRIGKGHH